jgi:hypothetical protein
VVELYDKQLLIKRWGELKTERATWYPHWRELSDYYLPRSGRFFVQDRNRGQRRHNNIYDNTGTRAVRVLAAGLMSGLTSPARPWFKLETADPELMNYRPVKIWLGDVTSIMLTIFQRSNTYRALHSMYEELAVFGTAANIILPNFENVIHNYPLTIGEYAIAVNPEGQADCLYREFQKTVANLVKEFGRENCSTTVRNLYDRGSLGQWVTIIHVIEPRIDRDVRKRDSKNMPWKSCYFEIGSNDDQYLRESGFKRFQAVCPRWAVSGGDVYGNSPGMEALGDTKQLQHEQLRKAQGIDYQTNPPLQVPTSLKNRDVERLPGGITYIDSAGGSQAIRTAFDVNLNLQYLLQDIQDVRQRIEGSFYADLFLMLSNQQDARMTATEVAERHEEKLLMLGPVLERLQNELLDPLIDITFDEIMESGMLPPPPQELQGQEVNVQLSSMLAQAQRAVATNSIDRFIGTIGQVAQFKPEVLDTIDGDRIVGVYHNAYGIDGRILVDEEQVQAIREQRAKQQQAAQQAAMMNQGADTAHKLSQAQTGEPSALTDVTKAFSGYA